MAVPDAAVGGVVAALDGSPEESSTGGTDLATIVTVSPRHLTAHLARTHCCCPISSLPWCFVQQSRGPGGTRPLLVILVVHHLELVLLVLLRRQEAAHLHQRLQGVEVPGLQTVELETRTERERENF